MTRPYDYATIEDVRARLSFVATFGATSRPNGTQVRAFVDDAADELDAVLAGLGYTTPISTTATHSMTVLRGWNAIGAAWQTAAAMPQGHDSKHVDLYERRWAAILNGLRSGELTLPDAPRPSGEGNARFGMSPADGSGATPYFTRQSISDR